MVTSIHVMKTRFAVKIDLVTTLDFYFLDSKQLRPLKNNLMAVADQKSAPLLFGKKKAP